MIEPKTYKGPWHSFTATDANGDIDPNEIQSAITVYTAHIAVAIKNINSAIEEVRPNLSNALRNYNKDLTSKLDDLKTAAESMGKAFVAITEGLYERAVSVHDQKQTEYNAEAQAQAEAEWAEYNRQAEEAARRQAADNQKND